MIGEGGGEYSNIARGAWKAGGLGRVWVGSWDPNFTGEQGRRGIIIGG